MARGAVPEGLELVDEELSRTAEVVEASEDDAVFSSFLQDSLEEEAERADGLSDLEREFGGEDEARVESGLDGYDDAEEKAEPEQTVKRGRHAEINDMNISQRIRLALLGSKTDRGILIRDRNRLVCLSVIKSPKVQLSEAVAYAGSRNVHDDVIRYIAGKREWQKSYQMKVALARNPKTPTGVGLKLLTHLRKGDLKTVATDKNVSHVIAAAAKRMIR